jgi:hypothetical protein
MLTEKAIDMKRIKIYLTILLFTIVTVSCFEENDFVIPGKYAWVAFEEGSFAVPEDGGGSVTVNLLLSAKSPSSDVSVTYSVTSTDATEGVDYSLPAGSGTVTVPAGQNTVEVTLIQSVLNNENITGDRTVVFTITDGAGFDIGSPDSKFLPTVTVLLQEDDFTIFGYSSFEDVDVSGLDYGYTRPGGPDPGLVNNVGEAPVDFIATGDELGFDSSFDPTDVGDDGWEIIGVSNGDFSSGDDGVYTFDYGSQAYAGSDLDGTLEIVFDEVTIPGGTSILVLDISIYFAFLDGGDSEEGEGVELVWRTTGGDETVIAVIAVDDNVIEDQNGNLVGYDQWIDFSAEVSSIGTGRPVVRIKNDNNDDLTFVDNIVVKGF